MQRVTVVCGDGIGPEPEFRVPFLLVGGCALAGVLPLPRVNWDPEKEGPAR